MVYPCRIYDQSVDMYIVKEWHGTATQRKLVKRMNGASLAQCWDGAGGLLDLSKDRRVPLIRHKRGPERNVHRKSPNEMKIRELLYLDEHKERSRLSFLIVGSEISLAAEFSYLLRERRNNSIYSL